MAGDDEAGSGATTTAETDRPRSEDAATPDAPPSDREGSGQAPSVGDDDPPVAAVDAGSDPAAMVEAGSDFDVGAAEARLEEVREQIEEGRRALADIAKETDPEPDGPPVARGEGAANAPPG